MSLFTSFNEQKAKYLFTEQAVTMNKLKQNIKSMILGFIVYGEIICLPLTRWSISFDI